MARVGVGLGRGHVWRTGEGTRGPDTNFPPENPDARRYVRRRTEPLTMIPAQRTATAATTAVARA
ncbi:MAG: hypothetical protein QOG44_3536, partial [Acidimicrobiaceae bacterium]|nr:hypothetical protein [Acidimicrobiaceae bacterium]